MTTSTKKYLTGKDVFADYIPDYEKQSSNCENKLRDSEADAKETASRLLKTFKAKVSPE